jgi:hypothetical protein
MRLAQWQAERQVMVLVRIIVAVLFFAAMVGWRWFAHVAADAGPVAWVLVFTGLGVVGYVVTNRDEKAAGRPGYAWAQARRELVFPLGGVVAILLVGWALK